MVILYKKGNKKNIKNYRSISVLSVICKIFSQILTRRMTSTLDLLQTREQQVSETASQPSTTSKPSTSSWKKPTSTTFHSASPFMDYEKAFNSIEFNPMFTALEN